jgi:hypothetical protein
MQPKYSVTHIVNFQKTFRLFKKQKIFQKSR